MLIGMGTAKTQERAPPDLPSGTMQAAPDLERHGDAGFRHGAAQ